MLRAESLVKGEGWSQGFEEPPQRFAGEEGQGGRGHAAENEGGQEGGMHDLHVLTHIGRGKGGMQQRSKIYCLFFNASNA